MDKLPSGPWRPTRREAIASFLRLIAAGSLVSFARADGPVSQPTDSVELFAMGDWGEDTDAQRQVADQMARTATRWGMRGRPPFGPTGCSGGR